MANTKARKFRFGLFGYGAIALYVSFLVLVAAGVYGFNLSTVLTAFHKSEMTRDQLRTGRMVITTEDRTQCRSVKFNNETVELGTETVMECEAAGVGEQHQGSFSIFRNGFTGR